MEGSFNVPHRRRSRWELHLEESNINSHSVENDREEFIGSGDNVQVLSPSRKRRCRWEGGEEEKTCRPTFTTVRRDTVENELYPHIDGSNVRENDEVITPPFLPETGEEESSANEELAAPKVVENTTRYSSQPEAAEDGDIESLNSAVHFPMSITPSSEVLHMPGALSDPGSLDFDEEVDIVTTEFRRLKELLFAAELSGISQRNMERMLPLHPIKARSSYRSMINHAIRQSLAHKSFVSMCPDGHAVSSGKLCNTSSCPICSKSMTGRSKFWFMKPSVAIEALCTATQSFDQLLEGYVTCRNKCISEKESEVHDYFDGEMFQRRYKQLVSEEDPESNLNVFLSFSTDGFECAKTRRGDAISSWPLVCTVLNYHPSERSRANNALILGVVPGSHVTEYFETFLHEILLDFKKLEDGIQVQCADGKLRSVRTHVLFFTADWPAATKLLGYVGHTGTVFCRFCLKRKTYVSECKTSCALPSTPARIIQETAHRRIGAAEGIYKVGDITRVECHLYRNETDITSVWKSFKVLGNRSSERKALVKRTGIKNDCCFRNLSLDFKYSFPYDVMHLVLLGWTKHLLKLLVGRHARHDKFQELPEYCVPQGHLDSVNRDMESCGDGIPVSWGRPPLPLCDLEKYKAEDLKRHLELYIIPFFHRHKARNEVLSLCMLTSRAISLCFQYRCDALVSTELTEVLEELYARFVIWFYRDISDSYCFTPSTHAILHLPELMRQCGPLPITSQFLIERLLGDMGRRMTSKTSVHAHLFHKNHRLFALRIMNGGLAPNISGERTLSISNDDNHTFMGTTEDGEEYGTGVECRGSGANIDLTSKHRSAIAKFLNHQFSNYDGIQYKVITFKRYQSANIMKGEGRFSVETRESFRMREKKSASQARQKCCIAAEFLRCETDFDSRSVAETQVDGQRKQSNAIDLYYGYVEGLYDGLLEVKLNAQRVRLKLTLAEIRWQYGCVYNKQFDLLYTRDRRRTEVTIEPAHRISRLVGYLDISNRRYFIEQSAKYRRHRTDLYLPGTIDES